MAQLEMNKIISGVKTETIWSDSIGFDNTSLIPIDIGASIQSPKPPVSIMDLGKMLLQSAKEGETTKVHDLMCRGAPFTTDWLGTSPLHLAALHNHYSTCEVLLRAGICRDARTKVDRTPLHLAVFEGNEEIVELLLNNKCEVDARDMLKMTPLHWAIEKRHRKIVSLLLRHGADPCATSKFFKTPLSIAIETNQSDVFQELLSWNMRVNETELACDSIQLDDIKDTDVANTSLETSLAFLSSNDTNLLTENTTIKPSQKEHFERSRSREDDSTMQMLKDHGISMLDDTENTLFNSALQNGRKLVLSDAGKLLLNDLKLKKTVLTLTSNERSPTKEDIVKKKSGILMPIKQMQSKSNKVIKILSANEFKQMCGGNLPNTIKKLSNSSALMDTMKYQCVPNTNTSSGISKPKKLIINRSTMFDNNKETIGRSSSTMSTVRTVPVTNNNNNNHQRSTTQSMNAGSDTKFDIISRISSVYAAANSQKPIARKPANKMSTIPATTASASSSSSSSLSSSSIVTKDDLQQPVATTLVVSPDFLNVPPTNSALSEIERQLLELRKQTDELRRQLELSQKQNDEYKVRLEKLEQEKALEKDDRTVLRYRNGSM